MDGGEALAETLAAWGVEAAFAVPGESYLPVLAGLQRRANAIRLITPRHESGVTFACAAYGRIAGKPAVGLVSRGPGSTNASIGLHVAQQDSVPMLLVIGDVPTPSKGREAFQEIDYHKMFSGITKAVLEPQTATDVPQKAARALELAAAGRPGPVVLVMPKDISDGDAGAPSVPQPVPRTPLIPDAEAIAAAARLVDAARHPIVIAGELIAFEGAEAALSDFAAASGAAVTAAYRCPGRHCQSRSRLYRASGDQPGRLPGAGLGGGRPRHRRRGKAGRHHDPRLLDDPGRPDADPHPPRRRSPGPLAVRSSHPGRRAVPHWRRWPPPSRTAARARQRMAGRA